MIERLQQWFGKILTELTSFKESPHILAFSFAFGVFLGVLPFTGVVAAIFLAWVLKLNKPAAVLGSVITNTWLGVITLGIAIQLGSGIMHMDFQNVSDQIHHLWQDFQWKDLMDSKLLPFMAAVAIGYFLISFLIAVLAYVFILGLILWHRRAK